MIRLVASDIDGTLLQGGAQQIDARLFALIDALRAKNILFCAASGRHYASLRRLFAPVEDSFLYSC
ncbi:MAG: HAD hydrolase family protein [Ruthenibacterium sp.]